MLKLLTKNPPSSSFLYGFFSNRKCSKGSSRATNWVHFDTPALPCSGVTQPHEWVLLVDISCWL